MGNLIGATIEFGQFSWELTPLTGLVGAALLALYIIAAYDGMKFVFRGTRDYMSTGREKPTVLARLGGGIAALFIFFSGGAVFVAIIGWLTGAGFFTQKPSASTSKEENEPKQEQ